MFILELSHYLSFVKSHDIDVTKNPLHQNFK